MYRNDSIKPPPSNKPPPYQVPSKGNRCILSETCQNQLKLQYLIEIIVDQALFHALLLYFIKNAKKMVNL